MEYSIRELSEMAGVSARTLRYYDGIGLLKPLYVNEAGYRYYGEREIMLLQQILFYRERGFSLKEIRQILYQEEFDVLKALSEHLRDLEEQKKYTETLIRTVKQTILQMKGKYVMTDAEKFEAFKKKLVKGNEERYGKECRRKYGDDEVEAANQKLLHMSEPDYERFQTLEKEINKKLLEGVKAGILPESEEAGRIVALHKEWISMTWREYKKEVHKATANMYMEDERFKAYYDREEEGCAALLQKAVQYWADRL